MGSFVVAHVPEHKDHTAGARCCRISPDSLSFIPLTWGPKPFSALWQWGCGSRPTQKTHTPRPPHQVAILMWRGQRWAWTEHGEGTGSLCPEKSQGYTPAQITAQLQNQEDGSPSGLWVPCPRPLQVPSGLTHHQREQLIPGFPELFHVYTDHLCPWIPCSSQGNWDGWLTYMSPRYKLRPAGVLVFLPLSAPTK